MNTIGEPLDRLSLRAVDVAMRVAWSLYGSAHQWGRGDLMVGFVVEVFRSVGLLPRGANFSAQSLFGHWRSRRVRVRSGMPGEVVFYGVDRDHIHRVELCLGDGLTMGASGGRWRSDGARQCDYVRVRPIRMDVAAAMVDPFMREVSDGD